MAINLFDVKNDFRTVSWGHDPYSNNMLTILSGDKWKAMRHMMTPVFTSGKLRGMVPLIDKVNN